MSFIRFVKREADGVCVEDNFRVDQIVGIKITKTLEEDNPYLVELTFKNDQGKITLNLDTKEKVLEHVRQIIPTYSFTENF